MSTFLEVKNISKSFSKNIVLSDVNFDVRSGEVHALLGENGAGKSTLVKILGGIYQPNGGQICLNGKECSFNGVLDAQKKGIRIIHQELMLMPHLSIAENIFMGNEMKTNSGTLDRRGMERKAQELLDSFDMPFNPRMQLGDLTIAQQQMIEIIRAISFNAKIIAMDEPTSSLSERETEILFDLIRTLKEKKVGIILISHRLNDIFELADRVTVLRDGICVGTVEIENTTNDELVRMMVGRDIHQFYSMADRSSISDEIVMSVKHLSDGKLAKDVNFNLRKGEILGISGLVGAGRSEALQCIFGLSKRKAGSVQVHGNNVEFGAPWEAIESGLGYVCEDRKKEGLFLKQDVRYNSSLNVIKRYVMPFKYKRSEENKLAQEYADKLQMKITGINQIVGQLSGGNQQKVLISRWIACTTDILMLDEPTRGVDVKTKQDIYHLMGELVENGMSIIFISSELPELINVCDRIMVMSNGKTTGTLDKEEFDQETIMKLATQEFSADIERSGQNGDKKNGKGSK